MSRFIQVIRQQHYLLPPSIDEWLPENHLARFIVEVIDQLDLSQLTRRYTGRGSFGCAAGNTGLWLCDRCLFQS
jgi:hypothetical protein